MEKMQATKATVEMTVTFRVPLNSSWGTDCTVEQVFKQAGDEARQIAHKMAHSYKATVFGEPKISAIFTKRR